MTRDDIGMAATKVRPPAPPTRLVERTRLDVILVLTTCGDTLLVLGDDAGAALVGEELFMSVNTVKTHCSAIFRKLEVGDRRSAVQAGRDRRLL